MGCAILFLIESKLHSKETVLALYFYQQCVEWPIFQPIPIILIFYCYADKWKMIFHWCIWNIFNYEWVSVLYSLYKSLAYLFLRWVSWTYNLPVFWWFFLLIFFSLSHNVHYFKKISLREYLCFNFFFWFLLLLFMLTLFSLFFPFADI